MRNMRRRSYTEPILMPDLPRMRESKSPIADLLQSTDYIPVGNSWLASLITSFAF